MNEVRRSTGAQAAGVLTLVLIVGALLGILGDRLLADQRADRLDPVAARVAPAGPVAPADPWDPAAPAPVSPPAGPAPVDPGAAAGEPTIPDAPRPMRDDSMPPLAALPQPTTTPPRYTERLGRELDLTDVQRAEIDRIVEEERRRIRELTREIEPRFLEIAQQTRTRIEDVLTPEQQRAFARIRQVRMRQTIAPRAAATRLAPLPADPAPPGSPPGRVNAPGRPGLAPALRPHRAPVADSAAAPRMRPAQGGTPLMRRLAPDQRVRMRAIQDSLRGTIPDSVRMRLRQEMRRMQRGG